MPVPALVAVTGIMGVCISTNMNFAIMKRLIFQNINSGFSKRKFSTEKKNHFVPFNCCRNAAMSAPLPVANSQDPNIRNDIKPLSEDEQKDGNAGSDKKEKKESSSLSQNDAPYCVLPERQKVSLMLLASFAAIISPISSSIYFPAINDIAKDLDVSVNLVNLTITTYLVRILRITLIAAIS